MIGTLKRHTLFILVSILIILTSCDKFDGEQEVPAYISIDTIGFSSEFGTEGTAAQKIVDGWLYVDDQLIGGFELPFTVPVLDNGPARVEIRPGIILNGISATRAPYPYFNPIIFNNLELVPGEITVLQYPGTSYRDNTVFLWREEFEDDALAIMKGPDSDTGVVRTSPANDPEAFLDEFSEYSGVVYLTSQKPRMVLQSDDGNNSGFQLRRGDFIFLELHYRSDVPIITGMFINQQSQYIEKRPYIGLNPTDEWKKVYINFTPLVNESVGGVDYRVYLEAFVSGTGAKVYLDNIKLLSRENL